MSVCNVLGWRPVTMTWPSTPRCPVETPSRGTSTTSCSWRKSFVHSASAKESPSDDVFNHDEVSAWKHSELATAQAFIQFSVSCTTNGNSRTSVPLCSYGQQPGTTMNEARYHMYTKKSGKLLKIMLLPPTERNLLLHILRTHLQTVLAKSADQHAPPELDQKVWFGYRRWHPSTSNLQSAPRNPESHGCSAMRLQGGREGMRHWTLQLSPWKNIMYSVLMRLCL